MTRDLRAWIEALADEPKVMTLEHDRLVLRRKDEGNDARVVLVRCPHTIGLCFEVDTPEPGWLALLPCPCNDRSEVIADLVPRAAYTKGSADA